MVWFERRSGVSLFRFHSTGTEPWKKGCFTWERGGKVKYANPEALLFAYSLGEDDEGLRKAAATFQA